jgi:hypothetical protein
MGGGGMDTDSMVICTNLFPFEKGSRQKVTGKTTTITQYNVFTWNIIYTSTQTEERKPFQFRTGSKSD